MPANQPYDPRYNAKMYVPKLTEEQRLARATPIENLRRPRQEPALPETICLALEIPDPAPVNIESVGPSSAVPTSTTVDATPWKETVQPCVPTAREVVRAAFPEIYDPVKSLDSPPPQRTTNRTACGRFYLDCPLQHTRRKSTTQNVGFRRAGEKILAKSRAPSAETDGADSIVGNTTSRAATISNTQ